MLHLDPFLAGKCVFYRQKYFLDQNSKIETKLNYILIRFGRSQVPHGLGVRIPDSHSGGPGSIPGAGGLFNKADSFQVPFHS